MNMQATVPVAAKTAGASTTAASGKAGAQGGSLIAMKDAGKFTAALEQLLGGGTNDDTNPVTSTLAALLLGTIPAASTPADTGATMPEGDAKVFALNAVQALLSNPGLAEQWMKEPKLQLWLEQAIAMLQTLQMPAMTAPTVSATDAAKGSNPVPAAGQSGVTGESLSEGNPSGMPSLLVKTAQANAILTTFKTALQEMPADKTVQSLADSFRQTIQTILSGSADQESKGSAIPLPSTENASSQPLPTVTAAGQLMQSGLRWSSVQSPETQNKQAGPGKQQTGKVTNGAVSGSSQSINLMANRLTVPSAQPQLTVTSDKQTAASLNLVSLLTQSVPTTDKAPLRSIESQPAVKQADADPFNGMPLPTDSAKVIPPFMQFMPVRVQAPQQINAQYFAQDMSQFIMKNLHITKGEGVSEATISLYPQHLGQVDVKLTMQDGILAAQFTAGTAHGKELLENQLPQLRAALQTQGVQVDKLVVNQSSSMQSSLFHGQTPHQSSQQFNQQNKNRQRGLNYDASGDDFIQELAAVSQMRGSAYGNSFDVTA